MNKIYVSGNYIIVEKSGIVYEYAKGYSRYTYASAKFTLIELEGGGQIVISETELNSGSWVNEALVPYTVATFTTFLRENTGFKTAAGGSAAEFYASISAFPPAGENGILYVAEDSALIYFWDGSQYVELADAPSIVDASKREVVEFINKTGAPILEGTIVYIKTSSSSGTHPEVVLASASTEMDSSKTIGAIYETTANDAIGLVVTSGEVANLNTSMYSTGDRLWLSTTAGQVTTTAPTAPNHSVFIGIVTRSQNGNGRILYNIINGFEVEELHNMQNVSYSTPLDADSLLIKDNATSLWKRLTWANTKSNLKTYFDTLYQSILISGTNIKTINTQSVLGSGDLSVTGLGLAGRLGIANTSGVYTFYNDFTSAMAAAVAGQTIEMFADISTGSNVSINLKNGVNINGNGHSYFYSNSLGNCFQDNGAAVTCSILNLTISRTSSLSSGANVLLTGSSRINFSGSYIYRNILTDNYACIEIQGAARVFNAYCLNEYGRGIWSTNANSLIENCFGQTIQNSGYGIMSHGNVVKSTGIAVDLQGIFITTTTGTAINCIGISTSSQGIRGNTTNSTGISTSGNGIGATSISTHRNSTAISSSGGAFSTGGSSSTNYNCTYETNTGTFAASSDGGQYFNCSISVLSGIGYGIISPARVLNCMVRVTSPTTSCLYSATARTVNYLNNCFVGATSPVSFQITQGTTNTHDNQGNILL
jgi:hypothetical protein